MGLRNCFSSFLILSVSLLSFSQERESFEQFNARRQAKFDQYKEQKRKDFEEFRRKRNEEFAALMRKDWKQKDVSPVVPKPKDESVPPVPVVTPKEDEQEEPVVPPVIDPVKPPVVEPVKPEPKPFEVLPPPPTPKPQPEPIKPIEEVPVTPVAPKQPTVDFAFFGTNGNVRFDKKHKVSLPNLNPATISDAWLKMSEESHTNLIHDCLELRKRLELCDWAYLQMLTAMAESIYGKDSNEAALLTAYVYCQSGYKMRLASAGADLLMLFASQHEIYGWRYLQVGNEKYYMYKKSPESVYVCDIQYPKERELSLMISRQPQLGMQRTATSTHKSKRDANMEVSMSANKNMLDFYSSYPVSEIGNDLMTRWAMYANMPMPEHVKNEVYPQIRKGIAGCDQLTALNRILNWVQTGFVYEYDNVVWGYDRAFFPEESLHYPYCDCEDRSILLTRVVRDILGLDCLLVFYPGHLAAAVAVTEGNPTGDYFNLDGKRYFITDGTITGYGAPVGMTMQGMDNHTAQVIKLKR